jgi:GntR family transcriptional regulator/MocR family aminotransferase
VLSDAVPGVDREGDREQVAEFGLVEVPGGTGSRRDAVEEALRDAIRTGRLAPDVRLPPYRSFAADLGVARNTVADAYAELVAEGWLTAGQGSGTRVAPRAEPLRTPRTPTRTVRERWPSAPRTSASRGSRPACTRCWSYPKAPSGPS